MALPLSISGLKYETLHNKRRGDLTKESYHFFHGLLKGYIEILYGRNLDDVVEKFLEKSNFRLKTFLDAVNLSLYEKLEQDMTWNPYKEVEIFLEESIKNAPLENLNNQIHIALHDKGIEIKKPFIKEQRSDISCVIALMHSLTFYRKYYLEVNKCSTYNKLDFEAKKKAFMVIRDYLEELDEYKPMKEELISMFRTITLFILNNDEACKEKANKFMFGAIKTIRESKNITTYITNYRKED